MRNRVAARPRPNWLPRAERPAAWPALAAWRRTSDTKRSPSPPRCRGGAGRGRKRSSSDLTTCRAPGKAGADERRQHPAQPAPMRQRATQRHMRPWAPCRSPTRADKAFRPAPCWPFYLALAVTVRPSPASWRRGPSGGPADAGRAMPTRWPKTGRAWRDRRAGTSASRLHGWTHPEGRAAASADGIADVPWHAFALQGAVQPASKATDRAHAVHGALHTQSGTARPKAAVRGMGPK